MMEPVPGEDVII